jgi:hypothetical protein
LEDVLDAFAVEADPGHETLERYLRDYPEYAGALVDLSYELARPIVDEVPQSPGEALARADALWALYRQARQAAGAQAAKGTAVQSDPLAALPVHEQRRVAGALRIPRQVLTALLDRRVLVASIPAAFLARLAALLQTSVEALEVAFTQPAVAVVAGRSYKADEKPTSTGQATFDQVLRDAGVGDAEIAALLEDGRGA